MSAGALGERLQVRRRSARTERLRARAPRIAFYVVVGVLSLAGLRHILAPAPAPAPGAREVSALDVSVENYAVDFARAYLTYSGDTRARERLLAGYLSSDLDPDGGVSGSGSQRVVWAEVAGDEPMAAGPGRTVVVEAKLTGERAALYLAVPVARASDGGLELTGYPSLVGAPATARRGGAPAYTTVTDRPSLAVIHRALRNYLTGQGSDLRADLAAGAEVSLPTVRLRPEGFDDVVWLHGRDVALATVEARTTAGTTYTLAYRLGLRSERGRPYVTYIAVAPTGP
jgi:hypothetical protein